MTVKVTIDWNAIKVTEFPTKQDAFNYAQAMRESGFKVEVI